MGIMVNQKWFASHVNKVVTVDPSSKSNTTFIPIWYIMQTLKSVGLNSTWNGSTWNVLAPYTDFQKDSTRLGAFSDLSNAETALLDYPGGMVKDLNGKTVFTEKSFTTVDLRYAAPANVNADAINQYLQTHDSILFGLGQTFMTAQSQYGVNANYLVSHALEETGSGGNVSAIAQTKNNLYGYGAYDVNAPSDAGTFPSMAYAIQFQAWEVRNNYLNPTSSHYVQPTLSGISVNYASDPNWANKVNNLMDQMAIDLHDSVTSYTQYVPTNNPTAPTNSGTIPVYTLNGATATVNADPYYGTDVPVYTDGGAGHQHMFTRALQLNTQGDDVQILQEALNTQGGANLQTDGIFGAATQSALEQYQTTHGLPPTGICDFHLWNDILGLSSPVTTVNAGSQISIDGIVEGMAGGQVTEWFHSPNLGWINASDMTFNNVYRLTVPSPTSADDMAVPVTNTAGQSIAVLHAGDYVVSDSSTSTNGHFAIQFANQTTGSALSGLVDGKSCNLISVNR